MKYLSRALFSPSLSRSKFAQRQLFWQTILLLQKSFFEEKEIKYLMSKSLRENIL